jgi:hypothetical protein
MSTGENPMIEFKEDEIQNMNNLLEIWNSIATRLNFCLISLGLITIISSFVVSIFLNTHILCDITIKILACISTVCLSILTAFNVAKKANDTRRAWRILNSALIRYKKRNISFDKLMEAYDLGESLMGNVDFSFNATAKP